MKLNEFHVLKHSVGPVYHRHPVACGNRWIGGGQVYVSATTGGSTVTTARNVITLLLVRSAT